MSNDAGRGARSLDVSAERFPGWISAFADRHGNGDAGSLLAAPADGSVTFTAADGAVARCHPPFAETFTLPPGLAGPGEIAAAIAAHAREPRAVGVLLVRLGGYAAGVFTGYPPALADAKAGSRPVHGRSAAGGWSQQRFARRREKQVNEALDAAADTAVAVFGRWASGTPAGGVQAPRTAAAGARRGSGAAALDAVVLGGDKRAVAGLRDDPRLAPYLAIATERFLTVPDPRRAVLEGTPKAFTAVRIMLSEPRP